MYIPRSRSFLNPRNPCRNTLHVAAKAGNLPMVKLLMKDWPSLSKTEAPNASKKNMVTDLASKAFETFFRHAPSDTLQIPLFPHIMWVDIFQVGDPQMLRYSPYLGRSEGYDRYFKGTSCLSGEPLPCRCQDDFGLLPLHLAVLISVDMCRKNGGLRISRKWPFFLTSKNWVLELWMNITESWFICCLEAVLDNKA